MMPILQFMGGSPADTPTTPEFLRASDAERENAVSELRNEFAEGRLSHETFMYRMQSALDARNRGQLAGLFTDLPSRRPRPKNPRNPRNPKKLLARIRAALRGADSGPGQDHRSRPGRRTTRDTGGVPRRSYPAPRARRRSSSRRAAGSGSPSGAPATATSA